jgi:hypothetical protein
MPIRPVGAESFHEDGQTGGLTYIRKLTAVFRLQRYLAGLFISLLMSLGHVTHIANIPAHSHVSLMGTFAQDSNFTLH